jgi:chaperone protein EcpD
MMVSLFAAHAALAGNSALKASASRVFPVDIVITLCGFIIKKGHQKTSALLSLLIACVLLPQAQAAVRPMLTRVVAYAADKETPVDIINDAPQAYMVQSWLEDMQGNDDNIPLILTPPVMRLDGKQQGKLRLVVIPSGIPQDRESVYWLAVQEIPPKSANDGGNKLVMAIRSRIKVFVRPAGLKSEAARTAVKQLQWRVEKDGGKTWLAATRMCLPLLC